MIRNKPTEILPEIGKVYTKEDILNEIPLDYLIKHESIYGELIRPTLEDPMRNTIWQYIKFTNPSLFTPAANAFNKSIDTNKGTSLKPKYTPYIKGTKKYKEFWREERHRCLHGYEPVIDGRPCGIRIPGEYYFYLNYCRIEQVFIDEETGEEGSVTTFPKFTSMDYYYFLELDARENPNRYNLPREYKQHLILAKSRRKGFSYKNAAGATHKYTFFNNVKVAIISERGDKALETFEKAILNIDFLSEYTEFGGPHIYRTLNKNSGKGAIKAGVKTKDGKEKGRLSEIYTVSLHHTPDKASGAGCIRVIFEEAGMIKNLQDAWAFTEPTLRSGTIKKGIGIIFGTGGDMDGATQDFSEMFANPEAYGCAGFDNIFEEGFGASKKCGWFVSDMWFREGAQFTHPETGKSTLSIDKAGNPNHWVAELSLNAEREAKRKQNKEAFNKTITQWCKTPTEAFLRVQGNVFPVAELQYRLQTLRTNKKVDLLSVPGTLVETSEGVIFKVDLENKLQPINKYPIPANQKNREGAVVQFEPPQTIRGKVPRGAYIISIDPIAIDSEGNESLVAIYCIKSKKYAFEIGHDEVVMSYVGRPAYDPIDSTNYILLKMAKYYNADVTHENDRSGKVVRDFFVKNNEFTKLLQPPVNIMEKHLQGPSKTAQRKTGHSFGNDKLKELGELLTKRWLLEKRGVNPITGEDERNLDLIADIGLLEELISYNRERNCDRVMALMGAIVQMKETFNEYIKEDEEDMDEVVQFFAGKRIRTRNRNLNTTEDDKSLSNSTSSFFG
jgi:hypothetical protein